MVIALVMRSGAFLVPSIAMALSLAGLIESFRIRWVAHHMPFLIDLVLRVGDLLVLVAAIRVLRWSLIALWSRKRAT
jgi:hypothetical protein